MESMIEKQMVARYVRPTYDERPAHTLVQMEFVHTSINVIR